MRGLDVVTFGETMVLFNPDQMLPLEYVHLFHKQIGGAESNLAIGLQRLGHSVGWFSKLGNDPFGRFIHRFVRGEGVDTSRCTYTDDAPTGIFFKQKRSAENIDVFYYRKHSAASLLAPEDLDEEYIAGAKILHVTGITPALSPSCRDAVFLSIEMAKKYGVKVVFDPNIRLKLWGKEEARRVMNEISLMADYILPGMDEAELLTGKTTPEEVAEALQNGQDKTVIVKLGSQGAYYLSPDGKGYVKGFPAQIIDPVGAGDGFAAGVISGILRQETMETSIRRGNAVGAIVVGTNGDVEGLPSGAEVDRMLKGDRDGQDVKR